jgi:uncharacterized phage-associated protein
MQQNKRPDYFIWKAKKDNKTITNKKLQKLLYYSQAWNLVFNNKPLFKDKIEAWVHGPTIRAVYRNFKQFGYEPIQKAVKDEEVSCINPKIRQLLDEIWRVYGKHEAQYLELLTHNEGPWQEAREGLTNSEASNNEISLNTMKSFYSKKLQDAR